VPVGNALGVRGDMDIKDAYMDVGRYDYLEVIGRAKQDARAESNAGAITERPILDLSLQRSIRKIWDVIISKR